MRKIARQPTVSISQPPSTGPTAPAIAPAAAQKPTARLRAAPSKAPPSTARLLGSIIAAPIPCTARAAISQARLGAAAQAAEPAAKATMPITSSRRLP